MKDQYFGDIGDYIKYSILRSIAQQENTKVAICWMLTENDERSDGKFIEYLTSPSEWRQYDHVVFDVLAHSVLQEDRREVAVVENDGLIPNAVYFSKILTDEMLERQQYFKHLAELVNDADVIFLDPDNGMEVKSTRYGKKNSSKYLYWSEVEDLFNRGHSLLIYQHFSRKKRDEFIRALAVEMLERTKAPQIISIQTPRAVFFLVIQRKLINTLSKAALEMSRRWKDRINILDHTVSTTKSIQVTKQLKMFE